MTVALATLIFGLVIGYLGQRSRLCFISGYRDYALTCDTTLLKGVLGAFLGALGGFIVFGFLGGNTPGFPEFIKLPMLSFNSAWWLIVAGGLGVGLMGVLSGGCPFRMHVLAAEGRRQYWYYLLGFYVGLIFYNVVTSRFLDLF